MIRVIHTASGARYEVDEANHAIRRDTSADEQGHGWTRQGHYRASLRRDGEWLHLKTPLPHHSLVGTDLILMLEPIGANDPKDSFIRHTTEVVYDSIDEELAA